MAARAAWHAEGATGVGGIAPERLVFLDECGVLTNMARLRGRSPRGTRALGTVPFGHWTRLTVLGALGTGGTLAAMGVEAATSGAVFLAYLDQVLLPELRRTKPDAVPVLDNLRARKTVAVRRLLGHSGFLYRYLPPYSPDLSPIEPAFSKLKQALRSLACRSLDALWGSMRGVLDRLTPADADGYFRHCGYAATNQAKPL